MINQDKGKDSICVRFINEEKVRDITGFSIKTIRKWRCIGQGPPYYKKNRSVKYKESDVLAWMEAGRIETEA